MEPYLTKRHFRDAMLNHKFIIVRLSGDVLIGVNSRILKTKIMIDRFREDKLDEISNDIVGWYPCDFSEYLTHKTPFK